LQNLVSFGKKANDLLEHLEGNLKNYQHFFEEVLTHFSNHVINTSELKRRQEKLPSPKRTEKVKHAGKRKLRTWSSLSNHVNEPYQKMKIYSQA
jgi:hypothetical protein